MNRLAVKAYKRVAERPSQRVGVVHGHPQPFQKTHAFRVVRVGQVFQPVEDGQPVLHKAAAATRQRQGAGRVFHVRVTYQPGRSGGGEQAGVAYAQERDNGSLMFDRHGNE